MKLRLLGSLVFVAACESSVGPHVSPFELLFEVDRSGNIELHAITPDGLGVAHLTNHVGADRAPRWSPDGRKIVFTSERDEILTTAFPVPAPEIYVMNADGSQPTRLTHDSLIDSDPAWSPDGRSIVFAKYIDEQWPQIFQMDADGSQLRSVTNPPSSNFMPRWSPDGRRLAFLSNQDGVGFYSIHVLDVQADTVRRVPRPYEDGNIQSYDWAPDGNSFVFAIDANGARELYTAEPGDSPSLRRLTTGIGIVNENPVWSPLGTSIAYSSSRDFINTDPFLLVPLNIYVLNLGTGAILRVTHEYGRDVVRD